MFYVVQELIVHAYTWTTGLTLHAPIFQFLEHHMENNVHIPVWCTSVGWFVDSLENSETVHVTEVVLNLYK